jgi:nicotinate-nucleotide adenylyltransferase
LENTVKAGVLGGTFDPVHNAHLAMAQAALAQLGLDKVIWIPTRAPGYREAPVASASDRVAMLRMALESEPRFEIDTRELGEGTSGYTAHTLKELRLELGADTELWLLIGADQYSKLGSWYRPDEVKRLARIGVFARPGYGLPGGDASTLAFGPMHISGSEIRARARRGESLQGLVPDPVANYISDRHLYS